LPLTFPNVKDFSVEQIWNDSEEFNYFRGDKWMKEPCRTCDERDKDFGGCRCQAYALTKDMHATDPVCIKSPNHGLINKKIEDSVIFADDKIVYRNRLNSLSFVNNSI
jgi:pyrroloquinoline quinone biosynthesis protein E